VKLPIAEMFTSIQGEGKLTGVPSFFVRVSGCNLRCTWCDTPYASWKPEGDQRGVDAIVEDAKRSGVRHAVVTGGEPMIFDAVTALTLGLRGAGFHVTIETAGTVERAVACDLMSLSPKLSNSTPSVGDPRDPGGAWRIRHEERRMNVPVLQALIDEHSPPDAEFQLKFVVSEPAQLAEIEALLAKFQGWKPSDVLLMPEGVTLPSAERKAWIAKACVERGWRYCHRLHVELFGNVRGT
jgi:7-carboxy-7-deazaguanine synthase